MKWLIPALAFQPLDFVNPADDGLDKLFKRLEVRVFWQALEQVGEVGVGILVCHLGEHFEEDAPAKLPGLVGHMGCSVGVEQHQGIEDALTE